MDTGIRSRRRLIDSAIELFGARGYHGTTVRAIASTAGVNVGAVSYHFGGKRQLYRAAMRAAVDRLLASLSPGQDSAPFDIHGFDALLAAGAAELRIVLHDLAQGGEIAMEAAAPHLRRVRERLETSVSEEGAGNERTDARIAIGVTIAPVAGVALLWPVLATGFGLGPDERRRLLERIVRECSWRGDEDVVKCSVD